MVKFLDKIAVVVARNKRQGQVEAMIVSCAKFELSRGQTTKLRIRSSVVLYCTYIHLYTYTVSRTAVQLLHRM